MRIIDQIEHPKLKISIFDMHDKLSLQIEDGFVAITLKFRKDSPVSSAKHIRRLLEEQSYSEIEEVLQVLKDFRLRRINATFPPPTRDFDPII